MLDSSSAFEWASDPLMIDSIRGCLRRKYNTCVYFSHFGSPYFVAVGRRNVQPLTSSVRKDPNRIRSQWECQLVHGHLRYSVSSAETDMFSNIGSGPSAAIWCVFGRHVSTGLSRT